MEEINIKAVLNLKTLEGQDDELTIREYLVALLTQLWADGEGFSGKRPFGDSGWEYELYTPLVKHGFIKGTMMDDEDCIKEFDRESARELIFKCIDELGNE